MLFKFESSSLLAQRWMPHGIAFDCFYDNQDDSCNYMKSSLGGYKQVLSKVRMIFMYISYIKSGRSGLIHLHQFHKLISLSLLIARINNKLPLHQKSRIVDSRASVWHACNKSKRIKNQPNFLLLNISLEVVIYHLPHFRASCDFGQLQIGFVRNKSDFSSIQLLWDLLDSDSVHSLHWGINPPSKTPLLLFCQAPPPLNLQTVQAPLRQFPAIHCFFMTHLKIEFSSEPP